MLKTNSKSQQLFLDYITEHPYIDINDLIEDLDIKKNVVSRMLHTLEEKELIEYTFDPENYTASSHDSTKYRTGWIIK